MRILIQSYLQASHCLESEPELWDVILILDSGCRATNHLKTLAKRLLVLCFDDIQSPEPEKRLATSDDIRSALEFAESSTNLMVACRAGQSRSAALAFVIAHQKLGFSGAPELLNPRRHVPNQKLINLACDAVGSDELRQTFQRWHSDHAKYRLSDYYDEIAAEVDALELAGVRNWIVESISGD